jgi:hypothetical protein
MYFISLIYLRYFSIMVPLFAISFPILGILNTLEIENYLSNLNYGDRCPNFTMDHLLYKYRSASSDVNSNFKIHTFFTGLSLILMMIQFHSLSGANQKKSGMHRYHKVIGIIEFFCCVYGMFGGFKLIPTSYGTSTGKIFLHIQYISITVLCILSFIFGLLRKQKVHRKVNTIRICILFSVGVLGRFYVLYILPLLCIQDETQFIKLYSLQFPFFYLFGIVLGYVMISPTGGKVKYETNLIRKMLKKMVDKLVFFL